MSTHTLYPGLRSAWPSTILDLGGDEMPCRVEGSLQDLEVFGTIPDVMEGTFYRVMPDPSQPPTYHKNGEMFIPLDGDGIVSAFRFSQGKVDWTQKYVRTERYKAEAAKRKSLFGVYRNPFTHHPCVQAVLDSTANTNVIIHAGKLLALKENGPAFELDPHTLITRGQNPFGLSSKTFTAHPKLDSLTGNLVGFGYEATGLATRDICYFEIDPNGHILVETYFEWPFVGFIHDCILTKNYMILYNWSFECDLDTLKQGGHHWTYSDELPIWFAIIPRLCKDKSAIKFFKWHAGMMGHSAGGWENSEGKILFETTFIRGNAFPFLPERDMLADSERSSVPATLNHYVRWELDPSSDNGSWVQDPQYLIDAPLEFPRIDERFVGTSEPYTRAWMSMYCPVPDTPLRGPPALNALAQYNTQTGEKVIWHAGPYNKVQECVFIPRNEDASEGDGYVMSMINRGDLPATELVILDTQKFEGPPVAVVRLPVVLKAGLHGNWVESSRLV